MSELDWGPRRPAAVSWAGSLLFLVGAIQLVLVTLALILEPALLLSTVSLAIAVIFEILFALCQLAAAVGVIRLGRPWRTFALALAGVGALLQGIRIVVAIGEPGLLAWNLGFTTVYVLVFLFLLRWRDEEPSAAR
jgi:hypothetical protein